MYRLTEITTRINIDETTKKLNTNKKVIHKSNHIFYNIIKRIIDILAGLVGIIILIPMTMTIYIIRIIKKENDGPIFYTQLRIGKNGKTYKFYKYRTMCINADEKLEKYLEENEEAKKEYKKYKKLRNDPRISKFGHILRKTSIDEFPQFINVIKGDMSLVGPRPYMLREQEEMGDYYNIIIKCKPGLTGYWQVNGRSNTSFEDRLELDKYYVEHRSAWLDIKIILKTIGQIIKKKGAL